MAPTGNLPDLGVGITYCAAIEPLLERHPELFHVVEIEPQTTWIKVSDAARPYRVDERVMRHLRELPGRKLIHSVGAPVGGTVRPDAAQLELLRSTVDFFESPWASDHLSFNQTPELSTGFFLPPRQTLAGVRTVTEAINNLKSALPVPIAVETGVNYLRPRRDELSDGDFVARVVESADCGLLLDLHNLYSNAWNGRQPVDEYLDQLPLERVWEMHLAGGMELDGFWLDAHSGAIPDPLYALAALVIPRLPNLKAIIFEIFPSFVPIVGLDLIREQVQRLHELWALRERGEPRCTARRIVSGAPDSEGAAPPEVWERALGSLVVGGRTNDGLSDELEADPGIRVVEGLIHEFRASMIVGVLRLTSRFLMLALGSESFRLILNDYWSKTPPRMYAILEAESFAGHLETLDLKLPHLAKVLEFERTVLATLADGCARVISFEFEPLPLLRALAEGRLPDRPGEPGHYEIELTGDGPSNALGLDLEAVHEAFPFH